MPHYSRRTITLILCFLIPNIGWSVDYSVMVEIDGLKAAEKSQVLANLSLKEVEKPQKLSVERIATLYELGIEEINTTLKALGYYHATIDAKLLSTNAGYIAQYSVKPGPPILIRASSIHLLGNGQHNSQLTALVRESPLKKGEVLNQPLYENFKQNLIGNALQSGYLDAVFNTNKIYLNPSLNSADIILALDTGTQYTFGEIDFGSSLYAPDFLQHYLPFAKNSAYTTEKLLALQKALIDSDLFNKVRIEPELHESKSFAVPLKIHLTPKPRNKYTASVGFSSNYGPRAMLGWERRRAAYPGHRININGRTSKRLNQMNGQYIIPGKHPTTDRYLFGTQITEERPADNKYSARNETGITHIQKRGKLEQIFGIHYLSEVFRELPTDPKKQSHFVLPKMGYVWTNIEEHTLLQHGTRLSFSALGGLGIFLSTTNLIQSEAKIKWIFPIGDYTRLIARSNVGATFAAKSSDIPLSLRFFTGGDNTVRGYGYNSLGPKELDRHGNSIVVGGRYLLIGSVEIERKIYKKFGVALFADSGNAMNRWGSRLANSGGAGLRYQTPLGPLRLDIARPLLKGKPKPRIHLTFGMDL